ncbi:SAM-dependent methyltransferase [Mucilaginibacter sp. CSA2-8R]|uniref:class I SAM-dependent DNA methyltransferase n=1 Tax=Mucilaginibacter sp. CSA2-8R TaxID=3141542 RepID=UPI00315C6EEB
MNKPAQTLTESYFDDVYRHNDDPWQFETSEYERRKYEATVQALPRSSYRQGFEIGCSIGVLTELLAGKCQSLLSVDTSEKPLIRARQRLAKMPHVTLQKMEVPDQFPDYSLDLVVMSEVGYYLSMPDLQRLAQKIINQLNEGGQLLLVHWTPFVHDYPLTGDQVHETFLQLSGEEKQFKHLTGLREDTYRLDLFEKQAQAENAE